MYDDVSLGVWVDHPKQQVLTKEFVSFFAEELEFDLFALMIDPSDRAWNPTWTCEDLEKFYRLIEPYASEVVLTTWPFPIKWQIDVMREGMDELMGVGPVAAWETDQEFNWMARHVEDFEGRTTTYESEDGVTTIKRQTPLDVAGDYLVKAKRELCEKYECRNELTTFVYHAENSANADVAPHCDRLLVQVYGVNERSGRPISFKGPLGPGQIQSLGLDRACQIPGVRKGAVQLGAGHAAWRQRFPGKKPEEAMERSFRAAHDYPTMVVDHRWWSSKHIYGGKSNPYAARYLRTLRAAS